MASISKRNWTTPDGEHRQKYQVRYKELDGKIKRKLFDKRKDADEWRRKVEPLEPRRAHLRECYSTIQTVEEAIEAYLNAAEKEGVDGKAPLELTSIQHYWAAARNHLLPHISHVRLANLNPAYGRTLRDDLVRRVPNREYASQIWRILTKSISYAAMLGALKENPLAGVSIHSAKSVAISERAKMPTISEARLMVEHAHAQTKIGSKARRRAWRKWALLLDFGFETGMRIGEILALPWSCVDFEKSTVEVKLTVKRTGGVGKPKTKKAYRKIGVSKEMIQRLKEWREVIEIGELDLVFPGRLRGALLTPNTVRYHMWQPMMKACKLVDEKGEGKYTPHSMRHFKASISIAAGCNMLKLSRELGHASVHITYEVYGHLIEESADGVSENASRVSAILNSQSSSTNRALGPTSH